MEIASGSWPKVLLLGLGDPILDPREGGGKLDRGLFGRGEAGRELLCLGLGGRDAGPSGRKALARRREVAFESLAVRLVSLILDRPFGELLRDDADAIR